MRPSAEKTNQCFFFALSNVIGLASLVFKPSSTTRVTDLRDMGKTILIFSNIYPNLTKSLYEGTKCRLIVVKIPCLRQQSSNSGKTLKITEFILRSNIRSKLFANTNPWFSHGVMSAVLVFQWGSWILSIRKNFLFSYLKGLCHSTLAVFLSKLYKYDSLLLLLVGNNRTREEDLR